MSKNIYVIGDVHGCFYTLKNLVAKLPENADLIFVGDLCDKGLHTKEVIAFIKENNYRCVLGNHDVHMLKRLKSALCGIDSAWNTKVLFSGHTTVDSYKNCEDVLIDEHIDWIDKLPSYIEIENYFITHGFGLPYYQRKDEKKSQLALRTNRISSEKHREDWEEGHEEYDVINIFGHDSFDEVQIGKNFYAIDTGCKYKNKLTAIELGSMKIIDVEADKRDFE
ncbi:MAG: metallophosphoesterase [Campylobacterota bacterium]